MTLQETRELGIEFERRIQTMIPEKEYDKLDTETIYSFLNQYQDKYVHDIYRSLDRVPENSKLAAHVESVLQSLIATQNLKVADGQEYDKNTSNELIDSNGISIIDTARSYTFQLDSDYYMYIKSVSEVTSTYSFKSAGSNDEQLAIRILPNVLVSQNDVWKLIETPHNSLRILKYPAVVLGEKFKNSGDPGEAKRTITVIFDQYTTIKGIRVMYYKEPQHFDIMTSTPCELPNVVFEDLVSGAVDLYVQYVAGAEARKRQQDEAARRNAQQNQRQNKESNDE